MSDAASFDERPSVEDDPKKAILYGAYGFPIAIARKTAMRPNFAEQASECRTMEYGFGVQPGRIAEALRVLADMFDAGAAAPQEVTHSTKAVLDDFTMQTLTVEFAAPRALHADRPDPAHPNLAPIARICHEANRIWCEANGDQSQVAWDEAPDWQRRSCLDGVRFAVAHPDAPPSAQHDAWMAAKVADGWVYGPEKDAEAKTHPALVPFDELPPFQKFKDALFSTIVAAAIA